MENSKNNKRILAISIIICCAYLLLTIFYYHIDKYTNGAVFLILTLLIPITFFAILFYCIKGAINIFRNRKNLITTWNFIPFAICTITLAYTFFSPYRLNSENLANRNKIVIRACYEGTQNTAVLKFRENQTFELHWTGFFSSDWFYGTYEQRVDTLLLNYLTEKPYRFGDSIVIKKDLLITINQQNRDSSQYFVPFYLGYCKGFN